MNMTEWGVPLKSCDHVQPIKTQLRKVALHALHPPLSMPSALRVTEYESVDSSDVP